MEKLLSSQNSVLRDEAKEIRQKARELRKDRNYYAALELLDSYTPTDEKEKLNFGIEKAANLNRLGQYKEALSVLEDLRSHSPSNPAILDQIGMTLRGVGRYEDALKIYDLKLLEQEDQQGLQGKAMCLEKLGRDGEAIQIYGEILDRFPGDVDAQVSKARILSKQGNTQAAEQILKNIGEEEVERRGWDSTVIDQQLVRVEHEKAVLQAELEQSKRLSYLGTMATATAHEINQPVGIIRAATSTALADLQEKLITPQEFQRVLERILEQTSRVAEIIDNFRKFARGDRIKRETFDLNELIGSVTNNFSEQLRNRDIHLKKHFETRQLLINANRIEIEEVCVILINNSIDALDGKLDTHITIQTKQFNDKQIGFVFRDNGPGLPERYRQHLFVPYMSTKPSEKGSGLGLFIANKIIRKSGGKIEYEDTKGGGASFRITLPSAVKTDLSEA